MASPELTFGEDNDIAMTGNGESLPEGNSPTLLLMSPLGGGDHDLKIVFSLHFLGILYGQTTQMYLSRLQLSHVIRKISP